MSKELIGSHSVHETLVRQTQIDAARIEELEAINEKLTDWVEKRKEDLTAAYRTIDYLRAELERQKKAREDLTKRVEFQKAAWAAEHEELETIRQFVKELQQ